MHQNRVKRRLIRHLLQDSEVTRVPRLRDDIELVPDFPQCRIVDVFEVLQPQMLLGHDG